MTERYDGFDEPADVTEVPERGADPRANEPTPGFPDFRDRARRTVQRIKRSGSDASDMIELAMQFTEVFVAGMQAANSAQAALVMYRACVDAAYFSRRWEDPKAVGEFIEGRMRKIPDGIMSIIANTPEGRAG